MEEDTTEDLVAVITTIITDIGAPADIFTEDGITVLIMAEEAALEDFWAFCLCPSF